MAPVRIRRLDVLLVAVGSPHPLAARLGSLAGIPPLGIAYLASVLRERGVSTRLVDLNVAGWTRERLRRCLNLQRPRVVGVSCMTESYRNAIRLCAWIRRGWPEVRIVVGGPHVSFEDAAALRTGVFDIIVRGEGEATAAELFARLLDARGPTPDVRGISYLDGGRIVRTPLRERISDLDTIPWPARDLLPLERYGTPGAVLTGRGCPGNCPFCSASAMSGGRYRVRDEHAVCEEVQALQKAGMGDVVFLDDTLTGNRPRLERLLTLFERSRVPIRWSCESRIEMVDAPLLRWMARLGCHSIQFGIESSSDDSQSRLGKGGGDGRIDAVLKATHAAGISPVCTFIIGLPWEDERQVGETIEFGLRLQREFLARVGFGCLVCYPGTRFWHHGDQYGLRRRTGDFDSYTMHIPTCDTPHLDRSTIRSLHLEAVLRQIRDTPRALVELSPNAASWAARLRLPGIEAGTREISPAHATSQQRGGG